MSTYQQSARKSKSSPKKPLSPASDKALDQWEAQNEIRSPGEPDLDLRAKTQTVSEGILRYMGESFVAPERYALGLVGAGEVEQVIDEDRPVVWMQNAPGPKEADRGGNAIQGSRESGDPDIRVGEQKERQQEGAEEATELQRQLDQTREHGEPGGSALSSEEQQESFSSDFERRGGEKGMSEREERRGRGEEGEERWMKRLITEQQETIDEQAETISRLVKMVGEEEEDEERGERRRRRRGEDEDEGRRGRRGRD